MSTNGVIQQVVFTNKARCRDCYRCVRVCPVKAIRMRNGQASVEEQRCLHCGTCIRQCPQQAKSYRADLDYVKQICSKARLAACSIAPSFAAAFSDWQRTRLASALRQLGFHYVAETAIGAELVAHRTTEWVRSRPDQQHVCTACPAVVRYVETYRPDLVDHLLPIVSPMVAHGRHIRRQLGEDIVVIFLGPCVAKKAEAQRPDVAGVIDAVLTFAEVSQWLDEANVDLAHCEESDFDELPPQDARLFALEGGALRTSKLATDILATDVVSVSGFDDVEAAIDAIPTNQHGRLIEPLFCRKGCINGPVMLDRRNAFSRRDDLLDYARQGNAERHTIARHTETTDLTVRFTACPIDGDRQIDERRVQSILKRIGKERPEDHLNCGACGYASCRDKAIAVTRGLAEPEMCMPHMKRLAEQRVDRIIETSPNGIVILDQSLRILNMNPAFRRFFKCSDATCGQSISCLMDPEPFERLVAEQLEQLELTLEHKSYGLVCHEIFYPLPGERQYVGIFVNVTRSQSHERELTRLKAQTVMQAHELLEQQIRMAETIASCLGENTAKSQALLDQLVQLADGEQEAGPSESPRNGPRAARNSTHLPAPRSRTGGGRFGN